MITFIVGETGAGKTAFATHLIKELYLTKRTEILRNSCSLINRLNEKFGRDLSFPDQVPVYSNYRVNLHVGSKNFL